jgi:hypothetical protein
MLGIFRVDEADDGAAATNTEALKSRHEIMVAFMLMLSYA